MFCDLAATNCTLRSDCIAISSSGGDGSSCFGEFRGTPWAYCSSIVGWPPPDDDPRCSHARPLRLPPPSAPSVCSCACSCSCCSCSACSCFSASVHLLGLAGREAVCC